MKVFISWSGLRSKYVADALRNWIPRVLQAVKPWLSAEDISTGARWSTEIATELEGTKVGIICLTPENQHNPWVMFEAGALSKTLSETFVCPYLYDLSPSQLSGPMSQFQAVLASKEGTAKIIQTLNRALNDNQLPATELDEIFDVWWPRLEAQLSATPIIANEGIVPRSAEELLEEILGNTREQLRREEVRLAAFQEKDKKMDAMLKLMDGFSVPFVKSVNSIDALQQKQAHQVDDGLPNANDAAMADNLIKTLEKSGIVQIIQPQGQPDVNALLEMMKKVHELSDTSKAEIKTILKQGKEE